LSAGHSAGSDGLDLDESCWFPDPDNDHRESWSMAAKYLVADDGVG